MQGHAIFTSGGGLGQVREASNNPQACKAACTTRTDCGAAKIEGGGDCYLYIGPVTTTDQSDPSLFVFIKQITPC